MGSHDVKILIETQHQLRHAPEFTLHEKAVGGKQNAGETLSDQTSE